MKPLDLWELQEEGKFFQKELTFLFAENRVYRLKATEESIHVYVLDKDQPLPYEVELHSKDRGHELLWNCECGSKIPCVHLGALFEKAGTAAGPDVPEDHWFFPVFEKFARGANRSDPGKDKPGGHQKKEESESPKAFETGKRWQEDIPLFRDLDVEDFFWKPGVFSYEAVLILTGDSGEGLSLEPGMLRCNEDSRQHKVLSYNERRLSLQPAGLLGTLIKKIKNSAAGSLPLVSCFDHLDKLERQKVLYSREGSPIHGNRASVLKVSFAFARILPDDRVLYRGIFRFFDGQGAVMAEVSQWENLVQVQDEVLYLDKYSGELLRLPAKGSTPYFLSLLLSKAQGLQAADIQGLLRLSGDVKQETFILDEKFPEIKIQTGHPKPIFKIRRRGGRTETFFFFAYENREIAYAAPEDWFPPEEFHNDAGDVGRKTKGTEKQSGTSEAATVLKVIKRDRTKEVAIVREVAALLQEHLDFEKGYYADLVTSNGAGDFRFDLGLEEFIAFYGIRLREEGLELQLENRKILSRGTLKFKVSSRMDWLDVETFVEDPDTGEMRQLLLNEHFRSLGLISTEAMYVSLGEEDLRKLEFLLRQGMDDKGHLEASSWNLSVIDRIYEERIGDESEGEPGEELKALLDRAALLKAPLSSTSYVCPAGLNAELRPYQVEGVQWLKRLHESGCNGCLADDMGLGKTLQTLTLLQSLKEKGELNTSLLVAPVVTLANWEREIERFCPEIRFYRHAGNKRPKDSSAFGDYDLIILSYHTLRNDVDIFMDYSFDYIILDEAHYIKNHSSRIYKAIRTLQAAHRLSLTGTPLENNTMELWSQFSFLNPGLLGGRQHFYRNFTLPIEKKGDEQSMEALRETVAPFLLRRKKEDVLDDLPPKEIIIHYSDMGTEQARLYKKYRDYYRARVMGLLDDEGLAGGTSIQIFQFLLKLRQLAIYPPLTGEEEALQVGSSKMDALWDILDEVQRENHKILVFSQFLGSLEAMGKYCREREWKYSSITGQTPDRDKEIQQFQQEKDRRIFLLSLKAGGVGINLTAADYVVIFDPWWNPSVERQAIDRAHRMGQTRKVLSYKMITRGSIEEKILKMQQEKTALMDGVMNEESSLFKSLGEEEIIHLFEA